MSLIQFLRIFWARRWLVVAATFSCLVGALIVVLIMPPRWQAHTRVMLNIMKPDPVTGQMMGGQDSRLYGATQVDLVTDYSVAGQVAEQLGWLSDPVLIAAYQKRSKSDQRDFRSWLAQLIIDSTKAALLQDSSILEITYTGTSAASAKAVADTLRKVYIADSLTTRREDAERNAEWYEQQAAKSKASLDAAIETMSAYEKANGIAMANPTIDIESARLQALTATGGVAPSAVMAAPVNSSATLELGQVDAQLAAESKVLGPNNPEMQALRSKRASLATVVAEEKSAARVAASGASAGMGAFDRAVAQQRSRVIADSGKIGRLTELQNDVNLRRDELGKLSAKVAQYREEALAGDAGITPLGSASTPKAPSFPNYTLIFPGALVLGGVIGALVALLLELLARRVRGVEDLASIEQLPLVGVVGGPRKTNALVQRAVSRLPKFKLRRRGLAPA